MSSPPGNLDGAIAQGSGGGSAGGRHLAQAPGQPGAACAPLGEQAPPFAALIRHRTGEGWIFGVFSIRRQSSTERGRGRWESRPRDPGTRTRPRGSPGLNAEVRNSKLSPLGVCTWLGVEGGFELSPRQSRWRDCPGQRRGERGWQAPGFDFSSDTDKGLTYSKWGYYEILPRWSLTDKQQIQTHTRPKHTHTRTHTINWQTTASRKTHVGSGGER